MKNVNNVMESLGLYLTVSIIMIAIMMTIIINHSKDVELEKYKIEMQVYGEPVEEVTK